MLSQTICVWFHYPFRLDLPPVWLGSLKVHAFLSGKILRLSNIDFGFVRTLTKTKPEKIFWPFHASLLLNYSIKVIYIIKLDFCIFFGGSEILPLDLCTVSSNYNFWFKGGMSNNNIFWFINHEEFHYYLSKCLNIIIVLSFIEYCC